MKKLFVLTCFLISATYAFSQDVVQEINNQIWKPYVEAYNTFNTEKFMALHSAKMVRVSHDDKQVLSFTEYRKKINRENQFNKNYKIKASIEFRFTERIHSAQFAHESGVYKLDVVENTGKKATVYGKFQVTLQKENNVWKILVDSDKAGDGKEGEKEFTTAERVK